MWELDRKEGQVQQNWCFWTVVLEKILESPLDCKEINPVNFKGNQPWIFIGGTDAEAEVPKLWPLNVKNWLIGKDPDAGKDWGQEVKGVTEDEMVGWHHQLNGHGFGWTLGVGDDREGWHTAVHGVTKSRTWLSDWTELNWSQWFAKECIFEIQDCKPFGTGLDFSQDYIVIGYCGMEEAIASFMIWRSWTIHQVPSFFFTGRVGVLHGKLVGTNSPRAGNYFSRGCRYSWASLLRGYCFRFGNRVGPQRTMTTSSAWWAHPGVPWSQT